MSLHSQLIDISPLFTLDGEEDGGRGDSLNTAELFKKFLWSFEGSSMHSSSGSSYEINCFDFSNLSPDKQEALEIA